MGEGSPPKAAETAPVPKAADSPPAPKPADSGSAPKAADNGAGSCGTGNSFTPDTGVVMADGSHKAIGQVRIGDAVTATDPVTGETGPRTVTALVTGEGRKNLVEITVTDPDGHAGKVVATDEHPFWAPGLGKWVYAKEIVPGMLLRTGNGSSTQVGVVRAWLQYQRVHNLTVDDLHTYYVLAGTTPVLVHNCDFVVGSNGTVVPTSASRLESGLQSAVNSGEPGFSTFPTRSAGVGYELPDGSRVRIMQPSANGNAGLRASFTNGSDAPVSPFTGKPVQPPRGVNPKQYVRERTHVELRP
ncbi:polymorphic toxin-type HINT domain-containing protein [Streptomyces aureus]|uniref:polymorphic toxin-type HINT domain-containing protein n=1 Tax=Streptomyces aureus TaxID=193461 RepID=UPI0006E12201|nr:polymorphic toxin-type HINT domain-containing protein [Streptomyces aureus]